MGREKTLIKLLKIFKSFNTIDCDDLWAITGGANHYLRGICPYVNDIDIISDFKTGLKLAESLSFYKIKNFENTKSDTIESFFGRFVVDNLIIELMADPVNLVQGEWINNHEWKKNIEIIDFKNNVIPLTTLKYEIYIYDLLGNTKKVDTLKSYIEN